MYAGALSKVHISVLFFIKEKKTYNVYQKSSKFKSKDEAILKRNLLHQCANLLIKEIQHLYKVLEREP